jgi:hypothetical protein
MSDYSISIKKTLIYKFNCVLMSGYSKSIKKFLIYKFNIFGGLNNTSEDQPGSGAINLYNKQFL